MRKRLGCIPHTFAQPVIRSLQSERGAASAPFEVVQDIPTKITQKLRDGELHGAFLSPAEFTDVYAGCEIIPGVGVASEGESSSVMLAFSEGRKSLATISADLSFRSEIILAQIVLAEKYETAPAIIPLKGDPFSALRSADAVLLHDAGNVALPDGIHSIDLVDEWYDIVELPFVHAFWMVRHGSLDTQELHSIKSLSASGLADMQAAEDQRPPSGLFSYDLDERALDGAREYLRMAYYYGFLKDIPDLKILQSS